MQRDLSNWNPKKMPMTDLRLDMIKKSLATPMRFLWNICDATTEDDTLDTCTELRYSSADFYMVFTAWASRNDERWTGSKTQFYAEMKKVGIVCKNVRVDNEYVHGVLITVAALQDTTRRLLFPNIPDYKFAKIDVLEPKKD